MRPLLPLLRSIAFSVVLVMMASLVVIQGCGSLDLKSHYRDRAVMIDGKNLEWSNLLTPLGTAGSQIGVQNDGEFMYIALVTANHDLQRQIIRQGTTFWFDREGGSEKRFGIHYPIGALDRGTRPSEAAQESPGNAPHDNSQGGDAELEILGPGKDDHARMTKAQAGGIEILYHLASDTLVYELKVPLDDNGKHPFAIGTKPGAVLGAGIETEVRPSTRSEGSGDTEGRRGGETGGPRGMGGRGRRGGGETGGDRQRGSSQGDPLNVWAKIQLATQDTTGR